MAPARRVPEGLIAFVASSAVLFAAGAAATLASSASMAASCGGALTPWLPMAAQTWSGAAASFLVMWITMMVPMMTPSLAPALWRYRQSVAGVAAAHWAVPTAMAAGGYFCAWALVGLAVYPIGGLFAATGMHLAPGGVVVAAGLVQISAWKQRQLASCREAGHRRAPSHPDAPSAWLHGMRLGVRCALSCGNLMAIVLVAGVMDLPTMAAVTAAVTLERTVPARVRAAPGIGIVLVGAGLFLLVRAAS